ncbi:uncharacterized protein NECHADRAFT_88135 [Fusarium vanettenii 77-13-4]|uniref:Uncharacterized protein n=1 Tax=Fusarium vanettenii (strain ATCC MYA-4622 / CBS 123669 / FGSC 9596 / NRRL 45880 / 77-13-4) TaxID=660122 RepID=C7ZDU5_FUSV7|nr:uncharacterized protein NECHADRAFT_88135 [Fusarium vanettenii 77-13-4]EEU37865.1 hypothetical protein NECHADRAFT_88135 [Fusarium vanettenii 77-13-4]
MPSRALWTLLLFLPYSVHALFGLSNETDFWSEFGNNFATDLAPIISLFGEQVTKQFLSESTTSLDTVIFAVGPLGIITAIVSCIRVSGSSFLKSVVGRAREPRAVPEVELCSSTSESVCELWSNGGICRVFGRPRILEFIFREPKEDDDYYARCDRHGKEEEPATCGIFLTREILRVAPCLSGLATTSKVQECGWRAISSLEVLFVPFSNLIHQTITWIKRGIKRVFNTATTSPPEDIELRSLSQPYRRAIGAKCEDGMAEFAPFPNLALNIGVQKAQTSILTLWLAAVFGLAIQGSFFWYTNWATWKHPKFYEGEKLPNARLFFALTIAGTASINVGMGLCAKLIDRNSKEQRVALSRVKETEKPRLPEYRMFWLQPGGQRIGDQEFDAFACNEVKTEYIASWNNRETPVPISLVWLGVSLSLVGWMVQFIGLRGQHATVSLYQLCCTITMSIIRASIRSSRSTPKNELDHPSEEIQGYELEWQALRLISEGFSLEGCGFDSDQEAEVNSQWSFDPQIMRSFEGQTHLTIHSSVSEKTRELSFYGLKMRIGWNVAAEVDLRRGQKLIQWIESCDSRFNPSSDEISELDRTILGPPNMAAKWVRIRTRLAHLTKQLPYQTWENDIQKTARQLKNTLQKASQLLYPISGDLSHVQSLVWSTSGLVWEFRRYQLRERPLCFCMTKRDNAWVIDENQLEAILGLWHWTFSRYATPLGLEPGESIGSERYKAIAIPHQDKGAISVVLKQWGLSGDDLKEIESVPPICTNLSVPIMASLEIGTRPRPKSEPGEASSGEILSVDATSSLLQMMAQDLFTTFVETIGMLRLGRLENVAFSNIRGRDNNGTAFAEGMVQLLVSESLATHQEAIMSVITGLYPRSGNSNSIQTQHLIFSRAISLRRQEQFDESQQAVKPLARVGSLRFKTRPLTLLYGAYRSEMCWMIRQRRIFTNRECLKRRKEILEEMQDFGPTHSTDDLEAADNVQRLQQIYTSVIDWLLWANRIAPAFVIDDDSNPLCTIKESSVLRSMQPAFQPPTPLDKKTLDDMKLDDIKSMRDAFELALTLDQRFSLGESSVQVRRQLLRWAIESECVDLAEDLWLAERNYPWEESAFSTGCDELFWAVSLHTDACDMINTILFLLEVVGMDQCAPLKCREEMGQSWWATSQVRDLIEAKYGQVSNVLAAASVNSNGRDVIELLTRDLDQHDLGQCEYVCEAVRSALEHGSLETLRCLLGQAFEGRRAWGCRLKLLSILAEWGLKEQFEIMAQKLLSVTRRQIALGDLESFLQMARTELPRGKEERAHEVFNANRDGLVTSLEERLAKQRDSGLRTRMWERIE